MAFTSDDLPVPREPVSSTLFAGNPATNWRVLASISLLLLVDRNEVREPDRVRPQDLLKVAALSALAPSKRARFPVRVRRRRRQQRIRARDQNRLGARQQRRQ